MHKTWFNNSEFLSHSFGFAYNLLFDPIAVPYLSVNLWGISPAADETKAPPAFAGRGDLVIKGPGGQEDTFLGIELAPTTGGLDRQRGERGDRFVSPLNVPPRGQLDIGERRQVQVGALGDRCKIKFDENQAPENLLGAEAFINVHGQSVLRFVHLRRDEFCFFQKLLNVISTPAPDRELFSPFTVEYSGQTFPINGTTCERVFVRQRSGVFLNTVLPDMEEHIAPIGIQALLTPRFTREFVTFLDREKDWQANPQAGIYGEIVEVADFVMHQGAFSPDVMWPGR